MGIPKEEWGGSECIHASKKGVEVCGIFVGIEHIVGQGGGVIFAILHDKVNKDNG